MPTLPPPEYWLSDTLEKTSIKTPLDERELVDMDRLVSDVREYVSPEFQWESPLNDVHHLQWSISATTPETMSETDRAVLREFRELVNRKMYIPRVFHNWIHWLTVPPPVPEVEVMKYSIDAQRVAMSLARTAGLATRLTRIRQIPEAKLIERLDQEFINYNLYMENARLVPVEFRRIQLEEVEVRQPEDLLIVNKRLGRLALNNIPVCLRTLRTAA